MLSGYPAPDRVYLLSRVIGSVLRMVTVSVLAGTGFLLAAPDGTTALHRAVYEDRTKDAKELLAAGADPSVRNRYGVMPLFLACANGNEELVRALLQAGARAGERSGGGVSPLMTAARTGCVGPVKALLEAGAHAAARDAKGQSALMWAAVEGHSEVVEILLQAGAERDGALASGFTAWFFGARQGHGGVIDILLAHGAEVNAVIDQGGGGRAPRKGTSALILAIENGHFDLARRLLEAGADPNDLRSGHAPLHVLSWVRKPRRGDGIDGAPPPRAGGILSSLQFAEVLIEHGARVNLQLGRNARGGHRLGRPGCTPFLLAARTADLPYMKLLLKHGADFRKPNAKGRTPLLAAAGVVLGPEADEAATEEEAVEAVKFLLGLGADIQTVDREGETVMHAAAYKQSAEMVRLLAAEGADIRIWNRKNRSGWTPLLIAQGFRHGNYKPSAPTITALSSVMRAAGVDVPPAPKRPVTGKKENYER